MYCHEMMQGEFAAGWFTDHLIVAEGLVNSLAEKFSSPLQVTPVDGGGVPAQAAELSCMQITNCPFWFWKLSIPWGSQACG